MGYKIQYGPLRKIQRLESRRSGVVALTGMFFLIFILMVNLLWSEGVRLIRESILPVDSPMNVATVGEISDSLTQGENIFEAVKTFLKSILHDGHFYSN